MCTDALADALAEILEDAMMAREPKGTGFLSNMEDMRTCRSTRLH